MISVFFISFDFMMLKGTKNDAAVKAEVVFTKFLLEDTICALLELIIDFTVDRFVK
jgi:hypothetical protein